MAADDILAICWAGFGPGAVRHNSGNTTERSFATARGDSRQ
jgi:hypothetical protein